MLLAPDAVSRCACVLLPTPLRSHSPVACCLRLLHLWCTLCTYCCLTLPLLLLLLPTAIFEFVGAVALGGQVAKTVAGSITSLNYFISQPEVSQRSGCPPLGCVTPGSYSGSGRSPPEAACGQVA
jgi:hypothetical protein